MQALLVVLFPGAVMVVALGLERVEALLVGYTADVAAPRLEVIEGGGARTEPVAAQWERRSRAARGTERRRRTA